VRIPNRLRRIVFRQKYRAQIRRDQEQFLLEHPDLRLGFVERGRGRRPGPTTDRSENGHG
jgi:hypothetical protein